MIVISEKRQVVGTLSTLVGRYSLLELDTKKYMPLHNFRESGALLFRVIDDEGFDNWITFRGDFIIIPAQVPSMVDVKRVVTEQEAQLEPIKALIAESVE